MVIQLCKYVLSKNGLAYRRSCVINAIHSFHHFPHFHVQKGKPGDTLIWDPRRNELLTADPGDKHHALCHRTTVLEGIIWAR